MNSETYSENQRDNIVIIMAGGLGKRMNSPFPKVIHKVLDKPMLVHVIERSMELNPSKILVVVGKYLPVIAETLSQYDLLPHIEFVEQPQALGTGHAIQCCRDELKCNANVLILSGDVPLIKTKSLHEMMHNLHHARIMTTMLDNPYGYGRIIEIDGDFQKIVEEKDCNEEERLCKKTNAGIYAFHSDLLYKYLPMLHNNNAQQEYYLTDIVEIMKTQENIEVDIYDMPVENQIELTGVNTKEQLEELNKVLSMEDKIQTKDTDNGFIGDDNTVYTNNTNDTNKTTEKPTVLLTGGAGFIGSHTYVELAHQFNVIIVDNLYNANVNVIDKLRQITESSVIFYEIDLLDKPSLRQIFQKHKPKAVIHFAGLKAVGESIKKPLFYYENNLVSTMNLLQTMEEHNCFQLIFSSSATVYGSNISPLSENMEVGQGITNPYGQTKFMIERILQDVCISNDKWNIVSLRYFNPVGAHSSGLIGENPNDIPNNLMPFVLKVAVTNNTQYNLGETYNKLNIFGNDYNTKDGTCQRDFIHVVDLAKGHHAALQKIDSLSGYNTFNLGSGNPVSVYELVKTFEKVNNVVIPYEFVERRQGDLEVCYCIPDKTYDVLQWKTEKNLEDICKDAWNFQQLHPNGF